MSAHVLGQLSAYLDRELEGGERATVDAHLRECAECARALDEIQAVDALVRGADVEAPAGYFERLPARLRARLAPGGRARVPAWAVALAAGLVVAVAAPLVMRERPAGVAPAAAPPSFAPATPSAPPAAEPMAQAPGPTATAAPLAPAEPQARVGGGAAGSRLARRERGTAGETKEEPARERGLASAMPPPPPHAAPPEARPDAPALAASAPAAGAAAQDAAAAEEEDEATALVSDDSAPRRQSAAPARGALGNRGRGAVVADERFRALSSRTTRSAAEARSLRDAWLAFVAEAPDGPHADDARLRALEAGAAAWRLGGRPEDRAALEHDGREYLRRADGAHKERVRALLAGLEP
jgi:hypothetical protein